MNEMDGLLSALNGGTLFITSDQDSLRASLTRIQAENLLDEAPPNTDFSILTPNRCYEFSFYTPGLSITDLRSQMPINPQPNNSDFLRYLPGRTRWPTRTRLTGLTIHHTMSHSPLATVKYITNPSPGGKGYPAGQYHYWVSQDTDCPVYLLLSETVAPWHDHCGISPNLSIGMAGSLHLTRPPEEQLWRTVQLVHSLLQKHSLTIDDVSGHCDRASYSTTVCPGWYADSIDNPSGVWKRDFCIALQAHIDGKEWGGY